MSKNKSISARLFHSYAMVVVLIFSLLLLGSLVYAGIDMNRKLILAQEAGFNNVVQKANTFLGDMNEFSRSLTRSEEFKDIAARQLPEAFEKRERTGEHFTRLYLIGREMLAKDYRVGVYLKSGEYIWMGTNYFVEKFDNSSGFPFETVGLGNLRVQFVQENNFLKENHSRNPYYEDDLVPMISLQRDLNLATPNYFPSGVLDICVPYERFQKVMDEVTAANGMEITICTADNAAVYGDKENQIPINMNENTVEKKKYKCDGKTIQIEPIMDSHLYVVGMISTAKLYRPLFLYLIGVSCGFMIVMAGLLFIVYQISLKMSRPVKDMTNQIRKIDFNGDSWISYEHVESDILELNVLSDALMLMQNKLRNSLDEAISLRSYELQSRMLALQAQMQPHFLYNTLMTINAMAEEHEDEESARMCRHLMHMLRYISSEDAHGVTLAKELKHLQDYVQIMKERFPNTEVLCDIPLAMMQITVPKLIIQPLVENSLKYCDRADCSITLSGEIRDNCFQITVTDNGIGFTVEKIGEIMKRCRELVENQEFSTVKINGMGLANIYARLHMYYGEKMLFYIGRREDGEGGSCIRIGGAVECDGE